MGKVFITGATGQVGSELTNHLVKEKLLGISNPADVICLIRSPEKASFLRSLGVTLVKGELEDSDTIFDIFEKEPIEFVFHVAANCLVTASYDELYPPNVLGTRIMLEAFVNSEAKCFVYTSSIAVYAGFLAKKKVQIIDEESTIGSLTGDPYAVTKRLAEGLVDYYAKTHQNKEFFIARLGPIVGPRDPQTLPSFLKAMSYRFIPKLINRGKDLFSLTSALDAARAEIFLARDVPSEYSGEPFNIAQEPISYKQIFKTIASYYGRKTPWFSVTYWFFKSLLPLLRFLRKIFPNSELIQTALSPICLNYLGKSYIYKSEKIRKLGFEFRHSGQEAILLALKGMDPERKRLSLGKKEPIDNISSLES
ncbi:MAG: NAD-dependent epimerase/dehydratase family protein [Candidatus Heimdallarchaeota archaeon]|nr:NAD-dependent epimerase/dehydratase family protein [Candidatus Heimdallarchaeota archaeon]